MKTKFVLLLSLIALGACSEEHEDLQTWMQEQRSDAKSRVRPVEKPEPLKPIIYNSPALIGTYAFDKSKMRSSVQSNNAPDINRPKELLENYSLENLKFVGTVGTAKNLAGLIEIDGLVYTVKPGNYVGQNYGKIKMVKPNGIEIEESVENADGNWVGRCVTLGQKTENSCDKE